MDRNLAAAILMKLRMQQTLNMEDILLLSSLGVGIDEDDSDSENEYYQDKVTQYLNKEYLIKTHEEIAGKLGPWRTQLSMENHNLVSGMHNKSSVNFDPKNKVDITTLSKSINKPLLGKFLLCRVIIPPVTLSALVTVVDEPKGKHALRFALYDYPKNKRPQDFLPVGTILAIKNPWFKTTGDGGFAIRVDEGANMVKIHSEHLNKLFPNGIKWECEIPEKYRSLASPDVIPDKPLSALDLKGLGNKCFVEKRFDDAADYYTRGLQLAPNNVDILSNRAAAYINIRCYNKALADVNKVLDVKPFHAKAIFRRVKALWGLRKYQQASDFLNNKLQEDEDLRKNLDLSNLLTQAKIAKKQNETGKFYDMFKLMSNVRQSNDVGEYMGPVKISKIEGKGRGLVATEKIVAGQLLICSKAFAIYFYKKDDPLAKLHVDWSSQCVSSDRHTKLVDVIRHKLKTEPETAKTFLDLHSEIKINASSVGTEVSRDVIDSIVALNNYGSDGEITSSSLTALSEDNTFGNNPGSSLGIWILPSYINDGCVDSNAVWNVIGDLMFVRAIKDIKKGKEILVPYTNSLLPYDQREQLHMRYRYICNCRICVVDRQEPESIQLLRKKLLVSINFQLENKKNGALHKLFSRMEELESLRETEVNMPMLLILPSLADKLAERNNFIKAAQQLEKAYKICKDTPLMQFTIVSLCKIVEHYIRSDKRNLVLAWVEKLRHHLVLAYGTPDVIKLHHPNTVEMLHFYGAPFF